MAVLRLNPLTNSYIRCRSNFCHQEDRLPGLFVSLYWIGHSIQNYIRGTERKGAKLVDSHTSPHTQLSRNMKTYNISCKCSPNAFHAAETVSSSNAAIRDPLLVYNNNTLLIHYEWLFWK